MAEETTPTTPTYHISIWDQPEPLYVCQLCVPPYKGTLAQVTQHLDHDHHAPAIPTSHIPALLLLRAEAEARQAGASPEEAAQVHVRAVAARKAEMAARAAQEQAHE